MTWLTTEYEAASVTSGCAILDSPQIVVQLILLSMLEPLQRKTRRVGQEMLLTLFSMSVQEYQQMDGVAKLGQLVKFG